MVRQGLKANKKPFGGTISPGRDNFSGNSFFGNNYCEERPLVGSKTYWDERYTQGAMPKCEKLQANTHRGVHVYFSWQVGKAFKSIK